MLVSCLIMFISCIICSTLAFEINSRGAIAFSWPELVSLSSHLPFGLLQSGSQLCVFPFKGGTPFLKPITFLQDLCKFIMQFLFLLLKLEELELKELLCPLGLL